MQVILVLNCGGDFFGCVFQLSQAAASVDNRVPTPASVASTDNQSAPDHPVVEVKQEIKTEEPEPCENPVEPKTEVISSTMVGMSAT